VYTKLNISSSSRRFLGVLNKPLHGDINVIEILRRDAVAAQLATRQLSQLPAQGTDSQTYCAREPQTLRTASPPQHNNMSNSHLLDELQFFQGPIDIVLVAQDQNRDSSKGWLT